jgi:iron complex transport system permease protein
VLFSAATMERHWRAIYVGALCCVLVSIAIALSFGAVHISASQLFSLFSGDSASAEQAQVALIVESIRLPRVLLALCVGSLLAVCGSVTQGLFRNPLADPSLIGVSAGAAAGASAVIVYFPQMSSPILGLSFISLGAFCGGIVAVILVYRIATGASGTSVATMLLAGIAITFLAGSITSVFEFLADNEMLRRISLWRMGGLDGADYNRVAIVAAVAFVLLTILPRYANALNALLLGESEAHHLGIDVPTVKRNLIICVAAGVGVSVALAGTIAFVGLVIPHMVRMLIGPNHRFLLPLSACFGAVLLLVADTLARVLLAPTELPVGLVTAFIGAPVFISLLRQRHHYGMQ